MKRIIEVLCIVATLAMSALGSTITGSPNTAGFTYTGVQGKSNVSGNDLDNSTLIIVFSDSTTASCTILASACTVAGDFTFMITPASSQTNSATWEIFNNKAVGTNILSATFHTVTATPGGPVGFDSGSIHSVSAGSAAVNGTETLTDAIHPVNVSPALATQYATLILTFPSSGTGAFVGGGTEFAFGAANHFDTAVADVPEPATYGMVGLALAGLGLLKFRRKKPS